MPDIFPRYGCTDMEKDADIVRGNFLELWKFLDCGRLIPLSKGCDGEKNWNVKEW